MRRIGPYSIVGEIARGGMGVVYRARGPLGEVALKALLDPDPDPRFLQEARAAARLTHKGIVRIHDWIEHDGRACLVMEWVEGESLQQRLRRSGPLSIDEALALMNQLCDAVAYAHAEGVIHRDLKPHNVLVDSAGRARLTDFGLGKVLDQSQHLTATGEVMGTPAYMPPEQATGDKAAMGVRSDVYGLGATLYALLVGHGPFKQTGASLFNLLHAVLSKPPQPPSVHRADVPAWLDAVVLRCLAKDPADRYPDAAALKQALRGPTPAPAPSSRRLAPAGVAASLALAGVLVAGLILQTRAAWQRPSPTPSDSTERSVNATPNEERTPDELVTLARARLGDGDPAGAVALCDRALELAPDHVLTLALRSMLRHQLGDHAGERVDAERGLALDPNGHAPLLARGLARARHGDEPGAVEDLERSLAADPASKSVREAVIAALQEVEGPRFLEAWFRRGRELVLQGAYAEALAQLERILLIAPGAPEAVYQRGVCRLQLALPGALADLEQAVPELTPIAEAHGNRAIARARAGDLRGALADCDRALELEPPPDQVALVDELRHRLIADLLDRARAHLAAQRTDDAQRDLDLVIAAAPDHPEPYQERALVNMRRGDLHRALQDADQAVALAPESPQSLLLRGGLRRHLGDLPGAAEDLRSALRRAQTPEVRAEIEPMLRAVERRLAERR